MASTTGTPRPPGTMLPSPELLPDVLPTDRLRKNGIARPEVRAELRRIPNARNAFTVVAALAQSAGVVIWAGWTGTWWSYLLAFLVMGRGHCQINILGHEAAHKLLFTNRFANDAAGRWLCAYPGLQGMLSYRRAHLAHHRDEMGPEEPDFGLYEGYPISSDSLRRKLTRDLLFVSGYKNVRALGKAARRPGAISREARQVIAVQLVMFAAAVAWGKPLLYPVCWLAPWMSVWKVSNRLRAIAEHGGMARSDDRRETTHVIRQSLIARFLFVPYNTGWHLAHHVDIAVPFRHLPAFHAELVASGWLVPEIEYPSYRALWTKLSSGERRARPTRGERAEATSSFLPA